MAGAGEARRKPKMAWHEAERYKAELKPQRPER